MSEEDRLVPSAPPRVGDTAAREEDVEAIPPSPPPSPLLQITVGGQETQEVPLAPTKIMLKSTDDEFLPTIKPNSLTHKQKSNKCLVYILSTIVITSILMLALGLTILRANSPDLKLRHIHARNLRFGTMPFASLEMDMVTELKIENANLLGRFEFHDSSSSIFYGNETLGISDINAGGFIEASGSKLWNVTVIVRSNNNNSLWMNNNRNDSSFSSDVVSKLVPMRSLTNLKGEVEIVKIINSKTTALLNCTMKLNLTSQAFQDINCN